MKQALSTVKTAADLGSMGYNMYRAKKADEKASMLGQRDELNQRRNQLLQALILAQQGRDRAEEKQVNRGQRAMRYTDWLQNRRRLG